MFFMDSSRWCASVADAAVPAPIRNRNGCYKRDEWVAAVFARPAQAPRHTFDLLPPVRGAEAGA
jgi:hypothetical protein